MKEKKMKKIRKKNDVLSLFFIFKKIMRIGDLPISFFNDEGHVQILLITVGMKVPRVFSLLSGYIEKLIGKDLELDSTSWLPESLDLRGNVTFSLNVCNTPDALSFLLGLGDETLPHNNYHVIVGAAVAESRDELINYANTFKEIVRTLNPYAIPCLYLFSTANYGEALLPEFASQLPIDSPEKELYRRIREGFVMFLMRFIMNMGQELEHLFHETDDPINLLKIASIVWIFNGKTQAEKYFESALKMKNNQVTAQILEQVMNPSFTLNVDKYCSKQDLPQYLDDLEDDPSITNQIRTIIAYGSDCKDKLVIIRLLIKLATRIPNLRRRFLMEALNMLIYHRNDIQFSNTAKSRMEQYRYLTLLLLQYYGFTRTFLYKTYFLTTFQSKLPSFFTKVYAEVLTSDSDWLEQRLNPASKIFSAPNVSREIKNEIVEYLLLYLHTIRQATTQEKLLHIVPSGTKINASILLQVNDFKYIYSSQPIEPATKAIKSSTFIFSPLEKRKLQNIASVGDMLSFTLTITNPLLITLPLSLVTLTTTNGSSTPFSYKIGKKETMQIPLVTSPMSAGTMKITGFKLQIHNLRLRYLLPQPIEFTVIEKLPTLVVCLPFKTIDHIQENSNVKMEFELVNSGDVELDLKPIKFAPSPPVLVGTSLPIDYPPKLNPPLPDKLLPGSTHKFLMEFVSDPTFTNLSFAIEYGRKDYIRRYEHNMPFTVIDGPRISRVEALPLDEHDDFDDDKATLLIVIENPTDAPVTVSLDTVEQNLFIRRKSFGTFIVNISRIAPPTDISPKSLEDHLTQEHIRKCETSEIKKLQRELTKEEKIALYTALYIKLKIKQQLPLIWRNQHAQKGPLPLTHVEMDEKTITLLQPPPFKVSFSIKRIANEVWDICCSIDSQNPIQLKTMLSFAVDSGYVLNSGKSVYKLVTPTKFNTSVHCDLQEKLTLTAKFFIGDAFFVKICSFDLNTPIQDND